MLFSEPKIPQCRWMCVRCWICRVSVLFSEPKIPQSEYKWLPILPKLSFSALQRAENSSIRSAILPICCLSTFQCSSASRKFLNFLIISLANATLSVSVLFSEPKIPQLYPDRYLPTTVFVFQCSSASRKFLNSMTSALFSALQRVSVLFSEPKIPQFIDRFASDNHEIPVSVLFSEPKIPQS